MEYVSLEKMLFPAPPAEKLNVILRIISTPTGLDELELPAEPASIVVSCRHQDLTASYFFNKIQTNLLLSTDPSTRISSVAWPSSIARKIREQFELRVTSETFYECSDERPSTASSKQTLLIPAFGFNKQTWKDGYLGHFASDAKVYSLIPPGNPYCLYVPVESSPTAGLDWNDARSALPTRSECHRQCLVTMLRTRVQPKALVQLQITAFTLLEATKLLLLRQAFPTQTLTVLYPAPKKAWPGRFKNFLESIQATWAEGREGEETQNFFAGITDTLLLTLVPLLNAKTKILAGL